MSREIKYRVWSKKLNKYVGGMLIGQQGHLYSIQLGFEIDEENSSDYIIEQDTGLKDKNGKRICEGDIVKCYSQDTYPVGRVIYSENYTEYEIVAYDPKTCRVYSLEHFGPLVNGDLCVIGNIHENPELLGGK